jgi:hypothetical protein
MGRGVWVAAPYAQLRIWAGTTSMGQRKHAFAISPHDLREVFLKLPALEDRGRREDRVRAAPAVSRAKCTKQSAHEHTGSAETLRPSLRNGFTAYIVLSPVSRSSLATVAAPKWIDPT